MAINLEMPKKLRAVIEKGHQAGVEMLRLLSPLPLRFCRINPLTSFTTW